MSRTAIFPFQHTINDTSYYNFLNAFFCKRDILLCETVLFWVLELSGSWLASKIKTHSNKVMQLISNCYLMIHLIMLCHTTLICHVYLLKPGLNYNVFMFISCIWNYNNEIYYY